MIRSPSFFSYAYQKKFKEGKPQIVYVIDEAQRYFRKGAEKNLKDRDVFTYFEYHRHWGQDIFLVTRNVKKLPSDIVYLPEYIVSAAPRVRSIGFGFKYHWFASGERIKTEVRRPDKAVFTLYKSMDSAEQEKISNPVLRTVAVSLFLAVLVIFTAVYYFTKRMTPEKAPASVSSVSGSSSVSSVVPVSSSAVSVADPSGKKPVSHYFVFVPLSRITRIFHDRSEDLYVWRDHLLPARLFPHKTVSVWGQRYAVLDYDLFQVMFGGEGKELPGGCIVVSDSSSFSGVSGEGGEAVPRSARRSDLSGGEAKRGA